MGTTLTSAVIEGNLLKVSQVGDSRAYLVRDKKIIRLTKDQTYIQSLIVSSSLGMDS